MKLVYWVSPCIDDSSCYNIRATTRKECKRLREEQVERGGDYGEVQRHELHYKSGFDLVEQCLGEGRAWEPSD